VRTSSRSDWRKCPDHVRPVARRSTGPLRAAGTSSGISDGSDGAAVLDYVRDGVSAHKAWFFSSDTVVCLGATSWARAGPGGDDDQTNAGWGACGSSRRAKPGPSPRNIS